MMMCGADQLVLGTLGIGSQPTQVAGYAPVSDKEAYAVMDAAWELGIREAETALSYGSGGALRRLSEWSAARGHAFDIVAKLGRPVVDGKIVPDYSPDALLREIDFYFDHHVRLSAAFVKDPPEEDIRSGLWETRLEAISAAHPTLRIGFASHALTACRAAPIPKQRAIAAVEANAVNWVIAESSIDHLAQNGFEVWAMQPLAGGFLTADAEMYKRLHPSDWRKVYSVEMLQRKQNFAARAAEALRAAVPGMSLAAAAHAFLLSQPLVSRVVIGPRLVRHLADVARALDLVRVKNRATA